MTFIMQENLNFITSFQYFQWCIYFSYFYFLMSFKKNNSFRLVGSGAHPSSNLRGATSYSISALDIPRKTVHIFLSREELLMGFNFYRNFWCSSNHRKNRYQRERWGLSSVVWHSFNAKLTVIDCDQGM